MTKIVINMKATISYHDPDTEKMLTEEYEATNYAVSSLDDEGVFSVQFYLCNEEGIVDESYTFTKVRYLHTKLCIASEKSQEEIIGARLN